MNREVTRRKAQGREWGGRKARTGDEEDGRHVVDNDIIKSFDIIDDGNDIIKFLDIIRDYNESNKFKFYF